MNKVILYGAGRNCIPCIAKSLQVQQDLEIMCIIDSDKSKQGELLLGIPILPLDVLEEYDKDTCIIVTPTKFKLEITENLHKFGFFHIRFYSEDNKLNDVIADLIECRNSYINDNFDTLSNLLKYNAEKINNVRDFLCHDEKSLKVFNAKIDSSFYGKHLQLEKLCEDEQYFPKDLIRLSKNDTEINFQTTRKNAKLSSWKNYIKCQSISRQ